MPVTHLAVLLATLKQYTYDHTNAHNTAYIDGSCSVDRINCSLVIPINRQMQSDGVSDIYFNVALTLSK